MISADVKSNLKQQEIKDLVAASYKLQIIRRSTFKTLNKIKRVCIFHLILVGIPSIFILPVKNRGDGGEEPSPSLIVSRSNQYVKATKSII